MLAQAGVAQVLENTIATSGIPLAISVTRSVNGSPGPGSPRER